MGAKLKAWRQHLKSEDHKENGTGWCCWEAAIEFALAW